MHKIFAKPLFLGKKVVFLPQCHSTNDELLALSKEEDQMEGTLVMSDHQIKGKGQRGNVWVSEPGKNITASFLLKPKFLPISNQYYLNIILGLGLVDALKFYLSSEIALKWPNDVYINNRKIAGILVESNVRGSYLESSVAGIGLNVNQQGFSLPNATSMILEADQIFDRDFVLEQILCSVEKWYLKLKAGAQEEILQEYYKVLMWRGELRQFKADSLEFMAEIVGLDSSGRLRMKVANEFRSYGLKEVEFIG